ncbi:MAG: DUF3592 domain-containing protein [Leptolyngbyaceae cyanobacterium]
MTVQQFKTLLSLVVLGFAAAIILTARLTPVAPVTATVTASDREYIEGSTYRPGSYRYTFDYVYEYQGIQHVSSRYTFGGRNRSVGVCNYRVGDTLTAHVSHHNPDFAVVDPHVSGFIDAIAGVGLLMVNHSLLDYVVVNLDRLHWLSRLHRQLGMVTGLTICFGGLGTLIYGVVIAATRTCVN